jgi:hypothetical protein
VTPLTIRSAPVAAVRREALPAKLPAAVVPATTVVEIKSAPMPHADVAAVKADARPTLLTASIPTLVEGMVAVPATIVREAGGVNPVRPIARVVEATPEPASANKPPSGYYVQMAALDSARGALAEWGKLRIRWPDLLAGRAPTVQQADVNQRTFWRLRTGVFSDAGSANEFCIKLHAAGLGCWTVSSGQE